jgi:hypothetical protein
MTLVLKTISISNIKANTLFTFIIV